MKKRFPNAVHFFSKPAKVSIPGVIMPMFADGGKLNPGETKDGTYQAKDQQDYDFRTQKLNDSTAVHQQNAARNAKIFELGYQKQPLPKKANAINTPEASIKAGSVAGFYTKPAGGITQNGNQYSVPDLANGMYNPMVPAATMVPGMNPTGMGYAATNQHPIYARRTPQAGLHKNRVADEVLTYDYQAPKVTNIQKYAQTAAPNYNKRILMPGDALPVPTAGFKPIAKNLDVIKPKMSMGGFLPKKS